MSNIILECKQVTKDFFDGHKNIRVLSNINLTITKGQKIAIMGRSGSGKTTLLQLMGGLDTPTNGSVTICNYDLNFIKERDKANLRNNKIGFIYQMHHLLPEFTAVENVAMPLLIKKVPLKIAKNLASKLLEEIGLGNRLNFKPNKLSGGERQRVAIARALINNPDCILADEPTGNLDAESAQQVMDLINNLNQRCQAAVIMVTHDHNLAKCFDKIYKLYHGEIA
jgi:lipoprotein-releasing system ATP-binding protein